MKLSIRAYQKRDLEAMIEIWNEVVEGGIAFPQMDCLNQDEAQVLFDAQSFTGVAVDEEGGEVLGLYILHPNNIGRCGHISNASYAVKSTARGMRIGEKLIRHSIEQAKELGFRILQFNAVVKSNVNAIKLYQKLGFMQLGVIADGFLMKDGSYEDIYPFYYTL